MCVCVCLHFLFFFFFMLLIFSLSIYLLLFSFNHSFKDPQTSFYSRSSFEHPPYVDTSSSHGTKTELLLENLQSSRSVIGLFIILAFFGRYVSSHSLGPPFFYFTSSLQCSVFITPSDASLINFVVLCCHPQLF